MKRIFKLILISFTFFIIFSLSSCQTTDKRKSYMLVSDYFTYNCDYDNTTNKTKVYWASMINNETIYTIDKIKVEFDYYLGDSKIKNESLYYDIYNIKNGSTDVVEGTFYVDGKIDSIKYVSWVASYNNLWDTYKVWWIVTIILSAVISFASVLIIIINDFDLDDVVEFIEDKFFVLLIFVPSLIISGIDAIKSNWVPILIVVGGIIIVALVILITEFIRYLIDNKEDKIVTIKTNKTSNEENVEDQNELENLSKNELIEICKEKNYTGYSKLNKEELILLIKNNGEEKTITNSNVTFDSIAGLEEAKKAFKEKVILPFEHPELFEKYGKKPGGAILLYGLPGTGKTMFAEAASNELDALFIPIKCSDIKSKWYGESEKNIKNIFNKARKVKRAIIFFDEFEAIGSKRTDDSSDGNNSLVPEILAEMQGVGTSASKSTIMVIAATNRPWAIDSAFLRPGRFDEKIYIPLPDFEARKALFKINLNNVPIDPQLDFDYLSNITEGFNGADIKEVCEKLKLSAINDTLEKGQEQTIGMDDVKKIEDNIKSSVLIEDIERLKEFENSK